MPDPNAVVSTVIGFEPPLDRPPAEMLREEGGLSVELEGERRVRLHPDDPRAGGFAQILDELRRRRLPVYVEVDPATSVITRLLIPHVTRVVRIQQIDEGVLGVELELSHARHVLRRGAWEEEILSYFDDRGTNAFAEGITNKVKVIKRCAYGFRNPVRYRSKVLLACGHRRRSGGCPPFFALSQLLDVSWSRCLFDCRPMSADICCFQY